MSLTNYIKTESVSSLLNNKFSRPIDSINKESICESSTENCDTVGMAFDYLSRFLIEINCNDVTSSEWVAKKGLDLTLEKYDTFSDEAIEIHSKARETHYNCVQKNDISRDLIKLSFDLARLETVYRSDSKEPLKKLGNYNKKDVDDCERLVSILKDQKWINAESAHLNPDFGELSNCVGGADADIIVDGNLIDIKSTNNSRLNNEYWHQLIGYFILCESHNTLCDKWEYGYEKRPSLQNIGIYFSRHGKLKTFDTKNIFSRSDYENIQAWFLEHALDKYSGIDKKSRRMIYSEFCEPYDSDISV